MDEPDQYSAASHEALKVATAALIEQIQQQVTAVGRMHGGSSEVLDLFQGNETVARAAHEWAERFGDHTGTWPLVLANFDDDEDDEDDIGDDEQVVVQGQVSVISRWDLDVVNTEALIAAGRVAHQRQRPEETDQDTAFAISDASAALYALTHEAGDPWWDIPGVEVLIGTRTYVVPDEPLAPPTDNDDLTPVVLSPPGRVAYSESWL